MAVERNPAEPDAARTTIVGGRPPANGVIPRHIPRGLEVLIKKAAVDPAFKKILFEQRAEAAHAIGLKLTAAEEAMLAAVPLPQLEGIIAHTRVSPGLRPAFLGYAAGAMLAVLGSATLLSDSEVACSEETTRADVRRPGKRSRGPGRISGGVRMEESGSWPYNLSGGGGGGGGAGMLGDRPDNGYVVSLTGVKGSSGGMRADRPGDARGRIERIPAKNKGRTGRKSEGSLVCLGSRADIPGSPSQDEPAPYLISFESLAAGGVSYRSAGSLRDQIKKRLPGIQNAYDAAVENNPSLGSGKLVARFTVDPEGRVVQAEIADDTLGDATLCGLILSRVQSWKFPAAGQANVVVEYPFVFVAKKE